MNSNLEKVGFYGDFIVLECSNKLTLINKHNPQQQRIFGGDISDFWVNNEKKEIVVYDIDCEKLFCWRLHPLPNEEDQRPNLLEGSNYL